MTRLRRLLKIVHVTGRYRLDRLLDTRRLPLLPRVLMSLAPWRLLPAPEHTRGLRLRLALEELGPVFVKFGQLLSTRRDLLPPDIADELARLQDKVPAFPEQEAVAIIERSLGRPLVELFSEFTSRPLASASVAQVHAATLHSGERVVVKVVRPGIEAVIRQDTALIFTLARLVDRLSADTRRLRAMEVAADYEVTILDELDLRKEAANASQLRRNFADSTLVYIPEVHWDYTTSDVYVMERIEGIPVSDVETLRERNVDLKLLGERGVEIFFTQVFRDSFFHADMHPGNVFVDATRPHDPGYIAVDCAIVGTLSESDQYYLARNLLAIFQRDYHEVALLHVECGWVPPETRVQDFESAMRAVCEPVFERPIKDISFGELLIYLFHTARRFDMEVQPSLVLLQKTLLNIEGLGRQVYPELNLWETAQPFLERWVRERYAPQTMLKKLQRRLPSLLEQIPRLPDIALYQLQQYNLQQAGSSYRRRRIERLQHQRRRTRRRVRLVLAVVLAAVAIAPVIPHDWLQATAGVPPASWALLLLALLLAWPRQD